MPLKLPLGISEFREVRAQGLTYVDKSLLIRDILDDPSKVLLLPRPRRFGKTTNLSMLRAYLERSQEPLWPLFADLAIAAAGPAYRDHFQRYPTVALTFKDIKARTWERCRAATAQILARLYGEHEAVLPSLKPAEAAVFTAILEERASQAHLESALLNLTRHLSRQHGTRALILLDEYDTPLHTAYLNGYYEDAVEFFRNLLSSGMKDNPHLYKGILTGVLRVAKDSIFTGMNNLEVYTLLDRQYATSFGFTEPEVEALLKEGERSARFEEVRRWYDGYLFGGQVIYNPWSVLSFLKKDPEHPAPYWAETSSNELVREVLLSHGYGLSGDMEQLLRGEAIERPIISQVAPRDLRDQPSLLWSLLLATGYLKVQSLRLEGEELYGKLAIPNLEVLSIYKNLFRGWVEQALGDTRRQDLLRALLLGEAEACARHLQHWLLHSASLWDVAAYDPPERFYHGFVLGLLVSLGTRYEVLSNRESGYGRCDVLLVPRSAGQPGVALELKVRGEGESIEHALLGALTQLRARDYAQALRARGAAPVHELAFVFDGKQVHARRA